MILAENRDGQQLLEFIRPKDEKKTNGNYCITSSFAFIKCDDKFIVTFNKWRKQWEFPAGKIESGESPKECAIRELFEETNQKVSDLTYKGLFKIVDQKNNQIRYRAAYYAEVDQINEFHENEETSEIMLWDLESNIGYFDAVDLKMLKLCLEL